MQEEYSAPTSCPGLGPSLALTLFCGQTREEKAASTTASRDPRGSIHPRARAASTTGAGPPRTWTCVRLAFARDVNATSLARPLHHRGSVDSVYNCSPFGGSRLNDHFILAVADIHCPVLSRRAPDDLVLRVRPPRCPRTPEGDGGAGCAEEARADIPFARRPDCKAPSPKLQGKSPSVP